MSNQLGFFSFKQQLTQDQYEYLLDLEDSDGFGLTQMIITTEGVHYILGEYESKTIEEHFNAQLEQVLNNEDED